MLSFASAVLLPRSLGPFFRRFVLAGPQELVSALLGRIRGGIDFRGSIGRARFSSSEVVRWLGVVAVFSVELLVVLRS